jgi:hypothetical protein
MKILVINDWFNFPYQIPDSPVTTGSPEEQSD